MHGLRGAQKGSTRASYVKHLQAYSSMRICVKYPSMRQIMQAVRRQLQFKIIILHDRMLYCPFHIPGVIFGKISFHALRHVPNHCAIPPVDSPAGSALRISINHEVHRKGLPECRSSKIGHRDMSYAFLSAHSFLTLACHIRDITSLYAILPDHPYLLLTMCC